MRSTIFLLLLIAVAGCTSGPENQEPLDSGVLTAYMDTTVVPGDDFNRFVNGAWMATATIRPDRPSNTVGLELQEQAEEHVRQIIEDAAQGDRVPGSNRQKIGDLYASYMDMDTRNTLGLSPLDQLVNQINAIASREDLGEAFARMNVLGITTPIGLGQLPSLDDPTRYAMAITQSGLGLPDREYYLSQDPKMTKIRQQYRDHLERVFAITGQARPAGAAATVLRIETDIARHHWPKEKLRDVTLRNNPYPIEDLDDLGDAFPWSEYLEAARISSVDTLLVMEPSYFEGMTDVVASTSLSDWKTYLTWSTVNAHAGLLNDELDQANFEFYGTVLSGTTEQLDMWRRGVNTVNAHLGEAVGQEYVAQHFPPEAKERMQTMIDYLVLAYEDSIEELDWMTDATREQALDKLSKFTPKIGYPDEWEDYSEVDVRAVDLVGNVHRSLEHQYQKQLDRQDGPVDRTEWAMTPQTVNAYYHPLLNEIVFPAAILQPPFFDVMAEDAVNYGAIGAVIGHEVGHGFDDSGSRFDGDGVVRNWWTDEDRTEFEKRTDALVAQYSSFKVFDDLNVNGRFTLGENIGDLGGLSIALKAYLMSLDGEEPPLIDGYTGLQRLFIGWGQVWRGIAREEAVRTQVATDPHSPREFRVNGVVRNIPDFYTAFDVSPEDSLYIPPDQRVKIW